MSDDVVKNLPGGFKGMSNDMASDQTAFKGVQWGKVMIAINNNGTGTPPTCNEKTSLVFGQSTTVEALPFMYEIKKQLNIKVSLSKKIHIITLPH